MGNSRELVDSVDNEGPPYTPTVGKLNDIRGIKRELGRLYKEARTGKTPTTEATKLTYILNILAGIMIDSDYEDRLLALEQAIEKRGIK